MSRQRAKPELICVGRVHYITIARDDAFELHAYLRSHGVRSEPPEPYQADTDSIHLGRGADPGAIQKLLDGWA
jgi:hypothetical protein